jgi:hypothetical protein
MGKADRLAEHALDDANRPAVEAGADLSARLHAMSGAQASNCTRAISAHSGPNISRRTRLCSASWS